MKTVTRTIWLMVILLLSSSMTTLVAQQLSLVSENTAEADGITVKFPEKWKTESDSANKLISSRSADGTARFVLMATGGENFDKVIQQVLTKYFNDSFIGVKQESEDNFEKNTLGLRNLTYSGQLKAEKIPVTITVQLAFRLNEEPVKTVLLIGVVHKSSAATYADAVNNVFATQNRSANKAAPSTSSKTEVSWLAKLKAGEKNLAKADFSNVDFTNVDLTQLDLSEVNLNGANFSGANLSGKDLSQVNLTALKGANFTGANLTNTNFVGRDLTGTNFTKANLTGADFTYSNSTQANFSGAVIKDAKANSFTKGIDVNDWKKRGGVIQGSSMSREN